MAKSRHSAGNTLALIAVAVGIILIIGFFVLNFNLLFSLNKEAKTAADAAALEGAKQIAMVTVDSRLGKLGLVDQSGADPNNPFKPAPVISFNTALATARLDLLVAEDLKNNQMVTLAKSDLDELRSKSDLLAKTVEDKFAPGAPAYVAVKNAFTANALRGGSNKVDDVTIKVSVGRVQEGLTNVPIPTPPDDAAKTNSIGGMYKACVNIPAYNVPVAFAAISSQPRLVEEKSFIDSKDGGYEIAGFGKLPPSVVKVEADFAVSSLTVDSEGKQATEKLHQIACAMTGGNRMSQSSSTAFAVSFLGGLPASQAFNGKISIQNLMTMDSPWKMPSGQDSTWLQADPKGNGFPGSSMTAKAFPGKESSDKMDLPSEALSYGLYDWLRNQGLTLDRQSVVNAFSADLAAIAKAGKTGKVVGMTGSDKFSANKSLLQPALAADDVDDEETADDSDDNDDFPVFGCMVSDDSMNATYAALLAGDSAGVDYYLTSFNYDLAWQMCPEEAMSILVDPVTGNAISPAGNDIIECCKLVEGTIATNRAGNVSAYAGLRAMVEAKRAMKVLHKGLHDAEDIQKEESKANPNADHIAEMEQSFAENASSPDWTLPDLRKVVRPISTTITKVDDEATRQKAIFFRAKQVKQNGTQASQKTYRLVRQLRKWSAKGIRQLDNVTATDDSTNGYMFVVKILGRGPRLVNIMPDDSTSCIRSKPGYTGPHFYDIEAYDDAGIERFRDEVKNVQLSSFPGSEDLTDDVLEPDSKIPPGKYRAKLLGSGNKIMTVRDKKGNGKPEQFRAWDSRNLGRKFLQRYTERDADTYYKDIKQLKAEVYHAMEKLGLKVPKKYRTTTAHFFMQPAYAQAQEELPIAQEKIFLLTCDNKGQVVVNYQSGLGKYPFSQVKLQPGQMLYFANAALVQGDDPTKLTYRSVLARDQFADLTEGKSYEKQGTGDWCHDPNYQLGEGSSDRQSCPQLAGEWQLQPPFAVGCCKLNPNKKHLGVKRGFTKWEVLNTELDPEDRIPPEILADMETETSLCPPLIRKPIRRGGRPH
ncbi:MAG: hypothetical protein K2Y22_09495 [Candidatus Obscuribacterales bacterium]|nr:hypothetical protein [Candidatus Obscuribacterales bacterium]